VVKSGGTVTFTAGALATLAFVQQPSDAAAGVAISPAVTVLATDAFANPISGVSVAMALASGTGTLTGGGSQTTNGSGVATFANLSINLVGSKTLTASSGLISSSPSTAFNITVGALTTLAFTQQPSDAVAGVAISPAVTVLATDTGGNPVSGASIAMALTTGTGTLSGTTPQLTNGSGIATFANLSINLTGTNKKLTASSGAASVASSQFAITAAGVATLTFAQQPTDTVAGVAITPGVKVHAVDSSGNDVPNVSIAMALSTGTGVLSPPSPSQLTNSSGVATFNGLNINLVGSKKLTASTTGPISVVSDQFNITARSTTTGVGCAPISIPVNAGTTCTVTVTDTTGPGTASAPDGTIAPASTGAGTFTTCTLSAATANSSTCPSTYTPTAVGTGTHNITAAYTATDSIHAGSNNNATPFSVTVTLRTTTTGVSCLPSSTPVNAGTTCTVTVTDTAAGTTSAPGGTIALTSDGTGAFTPCTLSGNPGTCTSTYTPTAVGTGTHNITAAYTATDSIHAGSNNNATPFALTVTLRTTTTGVTFNPGPSTVLIAQASTLKVTVTDTDAGTKSNPGGTVVLSSSPGGDLFGTCTLGLSGSDAATCTVKVWPQSSGAHTITATFTTGDSIHAGSDNTASPLGLTVVNRRMCNLTKCN
jgi:hypothetical protein